MSAGSQLPSTSRSTPIKSRRSLRIRKATPRYVHFEQQDSPLYRADLIEKSRMPRTDREATQQQIKSSLQENNNTADAQHQ
jgi:hypothetical protein